MEVRSARLFEFIMMLGAKPLTDGRAPGAAPPGSGVQGAAAPVGVQGAEPRAPGWGRAGSSC